MRALPGFFVALCTACVPTGTPRDPPASRAPEGQARALATASLTDGIYMSCELSDPACEPQLDTLGDAGFRYVLNYAQPWATMAEQISFLDRAEANGMKVIWAIEQDAWWDGTPLFTEFGSLFSACGRLCRNNLAALRYLVNQLTTHPAFWGWYVVDENPAFEHTRVVRFTDRLAALDPAHPRLVVQWEDPAARLAHYADAGDVLALDWYPIGEYCDGPTEVATLAPVVQGTADVATAAGKRAAFVLQSFSWERYDYHPPCERWPTATEMAEMRDAVEAVPEIEFVLWYSYFDILASDDPAGHWADLLSAIGT